MSGMTHRFACGAVLLVTVSEVSSLILFCSAPLQVCARRRLLLHQSITLAYGYPELTPGYLGVIYLLFEQTGFTLKGTAGWGD